MTGKIAETTVPLHPLLAQRWSPRAYDPAGRVGDAQLTALLEAARWSPSASNSQPWRFLVARRGTSAYDALVGALAEGNRGWAAGAPVLVLAAAATEDKQGAPRPWAAYDTGQAVAHLSLQAEAEGLAVHQMGGFDGAAVAAAFDLPKRIRPLVVLAIGVRGDARSLPSPLAEREAAVRVRRPLAELLLPTEPADLPLSA